MLAWPGTGDGGGPAWWSSVAAENGVLLMSQTWGRWSQVKSVGAVLPTCGIWKQTSSNVQSRNFCLGKLPFFQAASILRLEHML